MQCTALTAVSAHEPLSIGDSAFYKCSRLKKIYGDLSSRTPSFYVDGAVGDNTFYDCNSLTGIYLMSSVASIGKGAFYNCASMTSFFDDETLDVKQYWKLSSIGSDAFRECSSLVEFDIPASILSIGDHVFYNDARL